MPATARVMLTTAIVMLAIVCSYVVNILPVFLSVVSLSLQIEESQAGVIALVEITSIALASIVCALIASSPHPPRRRVEILIGAAAFILGNILSSFSDNFALFLCARAVCGLGAGVVLAAAFSILAEGNSARNMAIYTVFQLAVGWWSIPLLRPLAERHGDTVIFFALAATCFVTLAILLIQSIPEPRNSDEAETVPQNVNWRIIGGVGSVLLFWISIGAVYGYMAFMGVGWGGTPADVDAAISTSLFAALCGGGLIAVFGTRIGLAVAIGIGYVGTIATILLMVIFHPVDRFVIAACSIAFWANMLTPLQFSAIIQIDPAPRGAMLVTAGTYGGMAVGPAIAGAIVTPNYDMINLMSVAAGLASALLLLAATWRRPATTPLKA